MTEYALIAIPIADMVRFEIKYHEKIVESHGIAVTPDLGGGYSVIEVTREDWQEILKNENKNKLPNG